jgi:hypothetical protein
MQPRGQQLQAMLFEAQGSHKVMIQQAEKRGKLHKVKTRHTKQHSTTQHNRGQQDNTRKHKKTQNNTRQHRTTQSQA